MDQAYHTYRYPGSRPFHDTDLDRRLFWGRARESHELLHLVLAEKLVVVFARSGMGKSSLLNAGILEPLRQRNYLPLTVRVNDPERGPLHTVFNDVEETLHGAGVVLCTVPGGRLEREPYELRLEDTLPSRGDLAALCIRHRVPLWVFFKETEIWRGDLLLEPVLVFDQFEELFTLQRPTLRAAFIDELAALVRGPRTAAARAGEQAADAEAPSLKMILSLREDWLGSLEELAAKIPGILATRFRLEPLTREQAREAIERPAALTEAEIGASEFGYAPDAVEAILDYLSQRRQHGRMVPVDEVEPSQLQIVCQHLERLVRKPGHPNRVTLGDLGGKKEKVPDVLSGVLERYYEEQIAHHARWPRRRILRRVCERGLILDGRRTSVDQAALEKNYKVTAEELRRLTDSRLLRAVPRLDSVQYELSHDTLVEPIRAVREKRLWRRNRFLAPFVVAALAVTLVYLANWLDSSLQAATTEKIQAMASVAEEEVSAADAADPLDRLQFLILATAAFERTRRGEYSEKDEGEMRERLRTALRVNRETHQEHLGGGLLHAVPDRCSYAKTRCGAAFTTVGLEDCFTAACFCNPGDPEVQGDQEGAAEDCAEGSRLAVADRFHRIFIWTSRGENDLDELKPIEYGDESRLVAVDPKGRMLVSRLGGTLRLWRVDWESGKAVPEGPTWPAHSGGRIQASFHPAGKWLASLGADGLRVWDVDDVWDEEGNHLQTDEDPKDICHSGPGTEEARRLAWSHGGRWIASGSSEMRPQVWELKESDEAWSCNPLNGFLETAGTKQPFAFKPASCIAGECILAAAHGAKVRLWKLGSDSADEILEASRRIEALAWSPDGHELAYGSTYLGVWKCDVYKNRCAEKERIGDFDGRVLAYAPWQNRPGGHLLVSAGHHNLKVWKDGEPLVGKFDTSLRFLRFTDEGLVASDYRRNVKVLRKELSSFEDFELDGSHHYLTAVAFSADGKKLLSWGSDGKVKLREWVLREDEDGESSEFKLTSMIEPDGSENLGPVKVVALGPQGKFAASDSEGDLGVWEGEKLLVGPLGGHGPIFDLEFVGDEGTILKSEGWDGKQRLWDMTPLVEDVDFESLACKLLDLPLDTVQGSGVLEKAVEDVEDLCSKHPAAATGAEIEARTG